MEGVLRILAEVDLPWKGTSVCMQARREILSTVRALRRYRGAFVQLHVEMSNLSPSEDFLLKIESAVAAMGE